MNITIPMWTVVVVSIIAAVAITVAYFKGKCCIIKYDFALINQALETVYNKCLQWEDEREKLMAQACVSSGKCRRTPEEYDDILFKKMLEMENERRHPECDPADCKDCDPKDCVCGDKEYNWSDNDDPTKNTVYVDLRAKEKYLCPQCGSHGLNIQCNVCCDKYENGKINLNEGIIIEDMILARKQGNVEMLDCRAETNLDKINRKPIVIHYQLHPNDTEIIKVRDEEITRIDVSNSLIKQAVTESNKEAAESVPICFHCKSPVGLTFFGNEKGIFCSGKCEHEYNSLIKNPSHATALDRCASTKKAAQKSIGMTDDESIKNKDAHFKGWS